MNNFFYHLSLNKYNEPVFYHLTSERNLTRILSDMVLKPGIRSTKSYDNYVFFGDSIRSCISHSRVIGWDTATIKANNIIYNTWKNRYGNPVTNKVYSNTIKYKRIRSKYPVLVIPESWIPILHRGLTKENTSEYVCKQPVNFPQMPEIIYVYGGYYYQVLIGNHVVKPCLRIWDH